jgi:hypothetical protein
MLQLPLAKHLALVMHEQRKDNDDRKWNANQPEQCTSTETHDSLHKL